MWNGDSTWMVQIRARQVWQILYKISNDVPWMHCVPQVCPQTEQPMMSCPNTPTELYGRSLFKKQNIVPWACTEHAGKLRMHTFGSFNESRTQIANKIFSASLDIGWHVDQCRWFSVRRANVLAALPSFFPCCARKSCSVMHHICRSDMDSVTKKIWVSNTTFTQIIIVSPPSLQGIDSGEDMPSSYYHIHPKESIGGSRWWAVTWAGGAPIPHLI